MELSALSLRLRALSVLRGLLSHPLVRAYGDTLTALDGTAADFADRYGALCATRFSCGDIAQAVLDAVHFDTNTLTDTINAPEAAVLNAATHDLDVLNALLALDGEAFKSAAADKFYEPALEDLPDFEAADSLPFSTGAALADYYREEGYGFFAQSSAFAMQDDGSATPIVHPDAIRLHDLPGYEMQKQKILKNTLAFLDGNLKLRLAHTHEREFGDDEKCVHGQEKYDEDKAYANRHERKFTLSKRPSRRRPDLRRYAILTIAICNYNENMTDSCHTGRDFAQPLQKQQRHGKCRNKEMKRKKKNRGIRLEKGPQMLNPLTASAQKTERHRTLRPRTCPNDDA